jgi:Flp pilus assembly protein TadD
MVLVQSGRPEEAVDAFREALAREPDFAEAHANLGWTLLGERRLDEAERHLEEAARLSPDDARVLRNLGKLREAQGDLSRAAACYRRALEADPDAAGAHNDLGVLLAHIGDRPQALDELRHAVRLEPGNAAYLANLARVLGLRAPPHPGDLAEAERYARQACEITGGAEPDPLVTLARIVGRAGRRAEAAALLRRAIDAARRAGDEALVRDLGAELRFVEGRTDEEGVAPSGEGDG